MSLWKDYFIEKGLLVIETDKGFMSAYIHEGTCMVDNFYVKPESRGSVTAARITFRMVEKAKALGCHTFCAEIYKSDPLYSYILGLHKKFGMDVIEETEFKTVTGKNINKESVYDRRTKSLTGC